MAVKVVKNGVAGELSEVLGKIKKEFGEGVGGRGVQKYQVKRIPTGVFPFDLQTGGGFPRSRISIVYGHEGAGKTNLSLLACAHVQTHCDVCGQHELKCKCDEGPTLLSAVFIDQEHAFDSTWAEQLGVNLETLVLLQPDYAEQSVDMLEAVLHANDVGIVVLDSIAAMTQAAVIEASADRVQVGGNSIIMSKMVQKITAALSKESKRGHHPAVILLNQIRIKIGQMFGNPETVPGGNAIRFASSLSIRLSGKEVIDKDVSQVLPTWKETTFSVMKWKVPIVGKNAVYNVCTLPHEGVKAGDSDDWKYIEGYLRSYGAMGKNEKGKWFCVGLGGEMEEYQTLTAIREKFESDPEFSLYIKNLIIEREMATVGIAEGGTALG